MSESVEVFELPISVQSGDIDELGHVNNVVYLRWAQDAAAAHWRAAASTAAQASLVWVVVRHEIDYKHPARLGDRVVVRTWVGAASRFRFERHTEIVSAEDGRVFARMRSLWCPLDGRTGRPADVDSEVRSRFSTGTKVLKEQRQSL